MPGQFGNYTQYANTLICPKCGKKGSIVWEDMRTVTGVINQMRDIEGDFFERLSRRSPYPIELVCGGCGTVLPRNGDSPSHVAG